jgi:soluble lytic murein transglycosylase-like protein
MTVKLRMMGLILGMALASYAQASLYGYVDDQGVIHLANHKVNAHYQLFKKILSSAQALSVSNASNPVQTNASDASSSLSALPAVDRPIPFRRDSARFADMIAQTAAKYQLDQRLLHSIISVESGYNPNAVSPKGAIGLMQVMPATGRRFGVTNLADPQQNLIAGASYLRSLLFQFNANLPLAIAAYNAGEGAVQKYGNAIPPYDETRNYVTKVLGTYQPNLAAPTSSTPEAMDTAYQLPRHTPRTKGREVLIFRGDQPATTENW